MSSTNVSDSHSLTIEYALTRSEIFRSFWRAFANSARFRITILLYSVAIGLITPLMREFFSQPLRTRDLIRAVLWALGVFLVVPSWMFIRGKTANRTLTASPDGIKTEIGRIKTQIPWNKIRTVTDTRQFILIACTNGNAFFIPNRAFSGPDQRGQFLVAVRHWVGRN